MSQPRDGFSPDAVVCVLGAGKVSRMCPGRGILQGRVSIHRRDTFGYAIARHRGARAGFDGPRATVHSCCPRGAAGRPGGIRSHARHSFGVTGVAHGRRNVSVGEIPVRFHGGSDATTTAVLVAEAMKRTTVDSYDVPLEAARFERVGSIVGAGRRGFVMPGCADPGPVVALAIPGWNNLTARVFTVVPAEGRCDRWGAATTEGSR